MGNGFQCCCHAITKYLWRKDAPATGDAERSPLLSTDGSDCDWMTLPEDQEDELLTVITRPSHRVALEREHFLFPDIILSSSGVPVEPMVCLLVSEEDEGGGGGGGYERVNEGERLWAEMETQTEAQERQEAVMAVQTQTQQQAEVQTQTDTLAWRDPGRGRRVPEETVGPGPWSGVRPERQRDGGRVLASTGTQSDVPNPPKDPPRTEEESVAGNLKEKDGRVEPPPAGTGINAVAADGQRTTGQGNIVDEGAMCEENITRSIMSDVESSVDGHFPPSERIALKTRENVSGLPADRDGHPDPRGEDSAPARAEVGCRGSAHRERKRPTKVNAEHAEKGPAGVNSAGTSGGGVRTHKKHAVSPETPSPPQEAQVRSSDTEDRRSVDQTGLRAVDCRLPGPLEEREGVTLFLVDRLFLTGPHVKAPTEAPQGLADSSATDTSEQSHADQLKQDQADIQEVVDLHEAGFAVRIQAPGTETFELQVSGQMLVVELHQVLMDHEMTCQRTCFSLQLGGAALDALTELHLVPGIQEGTLIKVVEDPYTVRDARLHLRHVRDLLRSLDVTDAHNGVSGCSLSYLSLYTRETTDSVIGSKNRATERETIDCNVPEYIMPGCKERPLIPLQPIREDWKPLQCLRVLTVNSWNPPPGNRKMHGDLLYLNVVTVEGRDLNITACTRGFYLNQSTAFTFNPKPALPKILCHSLVELLSQVSPVFRKNFSTLQKKRVLQHPYERIATPYQVYTWAAPLADHGLDCVRAEETPASRVGQDEHTAGQSRDWNEELQGCRELPRSSLEERLHRERNIFKTNSDFVYAATQGAIAVVDGNVMAINPGEEPRKQLFVWNNLFFSLALDIADHYRPLGGDAAAHAAAICDLRGVQAYASVDIEGLHTLGTALVDYHGHRVVAQAIVPGLLEKNQDQGLLYGSNDHGQTLVSDTKFVELLGKTCGPLRIQRHKVLDDSGAAVELCSGVETKGILGNDGRHYILDLLQTFPPDLNFLLSERGEPVPEECKKLGFPRRHRHGLASLRPELIEAFVQQRYALFLSTVSSGLEKLSSHPPATETSSDPPGAETSSDPPGAETSSDPPGAETSSDPPGAETSSDPPGAETSSDPPGAETSSDPPGAETSSDPPGAETSSDPPGAESSSDPTAVGLPLDVQAEDVIKTLAKNGSTAMEDMDPRQRRVILDACQLVGSVRDTSFDICFNPDVCSPGVHVPSSESVNEVPKQQQLLWDAAAFLLSNQIPAVVRDFVEHTAVPLDGGSLRLVLHQRGVNMRYLGPLLQALETAPERQRLDHVQRICLSEVIIRSAKHIFRIYLQDVEAAALSAAVSHFLNCLLSSASSFPDSTADELLSRRRSRRRRSQGSRAAALAETAWARLTPGDLWQKIKTEAEDYYHFTLPSESIDEVVERFGLQKISLLREIAMKTGIQVQLRDYVFESRHRPVFSEEDVVNMSPVVKHLVPTAMDATGLIQQAQTAVQQGLLRDGYELIRQALTLFSSVCGIQHEDVSTCLRLLARISYIMGEYADALSHQEKAVMCSERVQGIDHPQTIQDYIYLALYCFAGGRPATVLRLLYRARYLTLLVSGEDHPLVLQLDSMLGLVLHGLMNYDLSLKFLQNALKITLKYHGATSLKFAHSHHLLATVYESKGEFRLALQHEKEAYSVYKSQAGEAHDSTRESSAYLQTLTKQAVILQRALNHIYSNKVSACTPAPKFSIPSLPMILQQLNITCGILLIPLSEKQVADLKTELKGAHKVDQ